MEKILILTSRYLPNPSANGINTKYIVEELKQRGYDITCISIKGENESPFEIIDGTSVYRVTPSLYSQILHKEATIKMTKFRKMGFGVLHFIRKVTLALLLFKFPNYDLIQTNKIFKLIESLHEKEKFHCVIGVFKPYSNIAALTKFRKNYLGVLCGGYYLDLINSSQKPTYMPKKIYELLCYRGDFNTFKKLDFVLVAKGGKDTYIRPEYDGVRQKIEYIDFPTFISSKEIKKFSKNHDNKSHVIVITYAGTLDRKYRNPSYLLRSIEAASLLTGNIELNIYGTGNCDDIINEYNDSKTLKIIKHGFKAHDSIVQAMMKSDILVNISNKLQNAVPSKIFEMFSIGKPIINLVFDKKDITTEYFERYPAVLTIEVWKELNQQVKSLVDFINKEKGNEYNKEHIKRNYIENTPEYTVNIIEKRLKANKFHLNKV